MLLAVVNTLSRGALCQNSFASPVVASATISDSVWPPVNVAE